MGRFAVRLLLQLVAATFIVGVAAALLGYVRLVAPGPLERDTAIIIPKGGISEIPRLLVGAGVISDATVFRLALRLSGRDRAIHAGEFLFSAMVSMEDVISSLTSGATMKRRLTVAEGLTTAEVLKLIAVTDGLVGDVPRSLGEGVLLPETYFFSYGGARAVLVARMRSAMRETFAELWPRRAPGGAVTTPTEALILASIIEKETAKDAERTRVSAVFHNRLKKHMRLQSDPTVVYAVTVGTGPLHRSLTRRDLATDSPYNTYRVHGLPPGPITNPGRASIVAALNPAVDDALYFVADGSGGHVFARTLTEHNRNVARWRRLKRHPYPNR